MYFAVSQYPEAKGMRFKEIYECIKFSCSKENIRYNLHFILICLGLLLFTFFATRVMGLTPITSAIIGGFLFMIYQLIQVNFIIRKAFVKHIKEFKQNRSLKQNLA